MGRMYDKGLTEATGLGPLSEPLKITGFWPNTLGLCQNVETWPTKEAVSVKSTFAVVSK